MFSASAATLGNYSKCHQTTALLLHTEVSDVVIKGTGELIKCLYGVKKNNLTHPSVVQLLPGLYD